ASGMATGFRLSRPAGFCAGGASHYRQRLHGGGAGGIANYFDSGNTMPNVVGIGPAEGATYCTGTLIDSRTVLTAAHCVTQDNNVSNSITPGDRISVSPNVADPAPTDV